MILKTTTDETEADEMNKQRLFSFEAGCAEAGQSQGLIVGAKGAGLADMAAAKIPVPPGFTISTEVCRQYLQTKELPADLMQEVYQRLRRVEQLTGKQYGSPDNPLLLSVRSGAPRFMPGMMETILCVGLNADTARGLPAPLAQDCLRRLQQKRQDKDFLALCQMAGVQYPDDPSGQLLAAIQLIFASWQLGRCETYRRINKIPDDWFTACTIQAMAFGNRNQRSGSGVAFTRDHLTGENKLTGEFVIGLPGEELVGGKKTPIPLEQMQRQLPEAYDQLVLVRNYLEDRYRDMMEIEFTVDDGQLWVLQAMQGERGISAAVQIAVELVEQRMIDVVEAIKRIDADMLININAFQLVDQQAKPDVVGLKAAAGAAVGQAVFDSAHVGSYRSPILVRSTLDSNDVQVIERIGGLLTAHGGTGSHFSVVCRKLGIPAVVGCEQLQLDGNTATIAGQLVREGDWITVDGSTGKVFIGKRDLIRQKPTRHLATLLSWADQHRRLRVRAFADSSDEVAKAVSHHIPSAVSTERMFTGEALPLLRAAILAENQQQKTEALWRLLEGQRKQFSEIFRVANGLAVIVRLLDPPLHEFLEKPGERFTQVNPLLGHRGCRLLATHPGIYETQIRAVVEACMTVSAEGIQVRPQLLVPMVSSVEEFVSARRLVETTITTLFPDGLPFQLEVGCMVETPRAVLLANELAVHADFLAVGLMDLTQCVFGASRDDTASFMSHYQQHQLWPADPFMVIDQEGVGKLLRLALDDSIVERVEITAWDLASIRFCHKLLKGRGGIVCPLPFVPVVKVAAAQAALDSNE